jgi:hypothetical protein
VASDTTSHTTMPSTIAPPTRITLPFAGDLSSDTGSVGTDRPCSRARLSQLQRQAFADLDRGCLRDRCDEFTEKVGLLPIRTQSRNVGRTGCASTVTPPLMASPEGFLTCLPMRLGAGHRGSPQDRRHDDERWVPG